ncbi:MAG: hypothetical protein IK955_08765 [Clostridia bacterium]|nr:hypothetical protein [Clostridia bacterium]
MANNVKKLPFPDFLLRTPCEIKLHTGNVNEDGDKEIYKIDKDLKCIYSEASRRVYDKDGKTIVLSGKVIVKGDIAPKLKSVSDGVIVINDNELFIHKGARPRNPDGTVHHTEFEVI